MLGSVTSRVQGGTLVSVRLEHKGKVVAMPEIRRKYE